MRSPRDQRIRDAQASVFELVFVDDLEEATRVVYDVELQIVI
ncbi:hypothetical protein HEB94_004961 [Actinopolymorpha pittospori]|uniref:Uncharacterized protein n=1 Tax=Actinopolymorpha pittospori TaxID=648752 RepID=A0A927N0K9_9ACTN|nr:hypothetical protein [Actinopolymorpha pittospori]MBE1608113.1 hypothetical protein [Actinopolymorpha pittospori]